MKKITRNGVTVELISYTIPAQGVYNIPLVTIMADIPRYILPQINTHKMLAKNTQSSRAIPVKKLANTVPDWTPTIVGYNCKGMAPAEFMGTEDLYDFQTFWNDTKDILSTRIEGYQRDVKARTGKTVEKGIINRLMENFKTTRIVISGLLDLKGWGNFIHLRDHSDAQSDIATMANIISELLTINEPTVSDYHLPMTDIEVDSDVTLSKACKESICNIAATSYRKQDLSEKAIDRIINKLVETAPRHWSPFEHPAISVKTLERYLTVLGCYKREDFQWVRMQAHYYGSDWVPLRKLYSNDLSSELNINSNSHEGVAFDYDLLWSLIK